MKNFPTRSFYRPVYFPVYQRDRNKHGGGLIVFTKKDLITKRKKEFESTELEKICSEPYQNVNGSLSVFIAHLDLKTRGGALECNFDGEVPIF